MPTVPNDIHSEVFAGFDDDSICSKQQILLTVYPTGARIDEARHLELSDVALTHGKVPYR